MKKLLLILIVSLVFMGCDIDSESEFAHMPTYEKTLIYSDDNISVYMIKEFDGYETNIYYIDNKGEILTLTYDNFHRS